MQGRAAAQRTKLASCQHSAQFHYAKAYYGEGGDAGLKWPQDFFYLVKLGVRWPPPASLHF